MFKDLKEYQDITKIYQDSVNISEEEREVVKIFKEENFTEEEFEFVIENFDELFNSEIDLTESTLNEEDLQELAALVKKGLQKAAPLIKKAVTKGATKVKSTADRMAKGFDKNKSLIKNKLSKPATSAVDKFKSGMSKIKKTVVGKFEKAKPMIKKGLDAVKKYAPLPIAGAAGFIAGKMSGGDKKTVAPEKKSEIRKIDPKQFDSRRETKPEPPKATETKPTPTETKPKKMHSIEKKNRARFGDEKVDKLKAKQKDFKLMRSKKMSKDDFIKKYPKSITAQKAAGLRDHTEWDAYDMVLEYLYSTEQVSSLEEANYVMMEMEQKTIGEIVKEVKVALEEEVDAPDMKYIMSHGMSDQTFANTAKKTFSKDPKDKKIGKDGYSTQNKFTAELLRRQANTGKDFSGNPLYKKKSETK